MSLGARITELRKTAGFSQYQLSQAMEVSRQAVSKWETDQTSPDAANLIRLAEILDTDIEYLTTGRRTFGRRPPVVIKTVETVEKVVEKPVVTYVEKPVVKKVFRVKYQRNMAELYLVGGICFVLGILIGLLF